MTVLETILQCLNRGEEVPEHLRSSLSEAEWSAVKACQENIAGYRTWRVMSTRLLDISQVLSTGGDPKGVYAAIVKHARALIGTDIAYISLNDSDSGYTDVLVTEGVLTEEFGTIHMPIGTGVLGLAASTGRPAWTYDHAHDPAVTHVDYVDKAVKAEGIRAILGAPIRLRGDVIGALLVGDRQPRTYSTEEISGLEVLAAIAGVALETAEILEEKELSVFRLQENIAHLEKLSKANSKFLEILSLKSNVNELLKAIEQILGAQCTLWETSNARFVTQPPGDEGYWESLISQITKLDLPIVQAEGSAVSIEFQGRRLGVLCVEKPLDENDQTIIRHASSALIALLLFDEALVAATTRTIDDLVFAVTSGRSSTQQHARLKTLTGIDVENPEDLFVTVFHFPNSSGPSTLQNLVRGRTAVTQHDGHLCALVQPVEGIDEAFHDLFSRFPGSYAAASSLRENTVATAHAQAVAHLETAQSLGLSDQVVSTQTLGAVGLILGTKPEAISLLVASTISSLENYDTVYGTELRRTAYAYLSLGHSVNQVSRKLYLHSNTVRQRLHRIETLLGSGWDQGRRGLDIFLALHISASSGRFEI